MKACQLANIPTKRRLTFLQSFSCDRLRLYHSANLRSMPAAVGGELAAVAFEVAVEADLASDAEDVVGGKAAAAAAE